MSFLRERRIFENLCIQMPNLPISAEIRRFGQKMLLLRFSSKGVSKITYSSERRKFKNLEIKNGVSFQNVLLWNFVQEDEHLTIFALQMADRPHLKSPFCHFCGKSFSRKSFCVEILFLSLMWKRRSVQSPFHHLC